MIEDPYIRTMLTEHDLDHYLAPKYKEPDLAVSLSRVLGSMNETKVHHLWSDVLLGRLFKYNNKLTPCQITDSEPGFDITSIRFYRSLSHFEIKIKSPATGGTNILDFFDRITCTITDTHFDDYIHSLHENKTYSYIRELKKTLRLVALNKTWCALTKSSIFHDEEIPRHHS